MELREQIARVIHRYDGSVCKCDDCDGPEQPTQGSYRLAQAIINELRLQPVETLDRRYIRYVTRWRNNPDFKDEKDGPLVRYWDKDFNEVPDPHQRG